MSDRDTHAAGWDDDAPQAMGMKHAAESEAQLGEVGLETPDADAAEQHTPTRPHAEHPGYPRYAGLAGHNFDVNEADAVDQERTVELDEDDYR